MALQIKENHGVFEVLGKIGSHNAFFLKKHLEFLIDTNESTIVSLEKVSELDSTGAHLLEQLYMKAVRGNKILSFIGEQNRNIMKVMTSTRTRYILSHDRV